MTHRADVVRHASAQRPARVRSTCLCIVLFLFIAAYGLNGLSAEPAHAALHTERAAQPNVVRLSVLTYNIHGLPRWIARDDPETRIPAILAKARAFDLVLLQEDFAYQALVDAASRWRHVQRGTPPDGSWLGVSGDGLTLLTDAQLIGARAALPYGTCNGWLRASSDCFANKGALLQRVRIANGAEVDVWTTHLDAGRGSADQQVRARQLQLLAQRIATHSAGRAVILAGDFNLHWDVPRDRDVLSSFLRGLRLTIAARVPDTGGKKRVDYVLFRPAADITMDVLRSGVDEHFVDAAGEPLSDHPAVYAEFAIGTRPAARAAQRGEQLRSGSNPWRGF